MPTERIRYKRLLGRRRGIMRGASVWLGPDHLLLVRSWRFREEYKRYYMRDIQSIAVAEAPRFHISTPSIAAAILWLISFAIADSGPVARSVSVRGTNLAEAFLWILAAALVVTWIYVSAKCSCICRIYTAVSGDELPSIYRTWTARKFMRQMEPRIAAVQGSLEGEWAEGVEARRIGPPEEGSDLRMSGASDAARGETQTAERSAPLAELFVAANIVDAVFSYTASAKPSGLLTAIGYSIVVIELVLAIALIIRHSRGRAVAGDASRGPGMRNLAIALIVVTGVVWYSQQVLVGLITAMAATGKTQPGLALNGVFLYFDIASHSAIGVVGLVMVLSRRQRPRAIITE